MLRNEPFIRYERSVLGGQLADRYLRDHQIHPRQRLEIDGLLVIAALVDRGIGVSLLPDRVSLWSSGMSLARLPLPGRAPVRRSGPGRATGRTQPWLAIFSRRRRRLSEPPGPCPKIRHGAVSLWVSCREFWQRAGNRNPHPGAAIRNPRRSRTQIPRKIGIVCRLPERSRLRCQ